MIRIGIDAISLSEKPSGVGKYLLAILDKLQNNPQYEIFLFSNEKIFTPGLLLNERVQCIIDNRLVAKTKALIWLKFMAGGIIDSQQIDCFVSNLGFFPKLPSRIKKIAIVHDLNYKIVPETMSRTHFLAHYFWLKKDVRSADFIIANSNGTADKVTYYFKRSVNAVIYPIIDKRFQKIDEVEVKKTLKALNVSSRYLLSVGNQEPRKNLMLIVNAFIKLKMEKRYSDIVLILVGGKGWKNESLQNIIDRQESIIQLGYINDAYLPYLYNGSLVFIFPSIYEGFGVPVREALMCGARVIAADVEEIKEAGESNAEYLISLDSSELVTCIKKAIESGKSTHNASFENPDIQKLTNFIDS